MKYIGITVLILFLLWLFAPNETQDLVKNIVGSAGDRISSNR